MYAFTLEKSLRLVVQNFCLAILLIFASASEIEVDQCPLSGREKFK